MVGLRYESRYLASSVYRSRPIPDLQLLPDESSIRLPCRGEPSKKR